MTPHHPRSVEPKATIENLRHHLKNLYGGNAEHLFERLSTAADATTVPRPIRSLDHSDVILIAYGDHVTKPDVAPLATLTQLRTELLGDAVSGVHILPFHPATSDGGFAVADFERVDPNLGDWSDIENLASTGLLMADFVLNHVSASHPWFLGFLDGNSTFDDFFIVPDSEFDFTAVVRARATPLLTSFEAHNGPVLLWTTFGPDQIDLNYRNPEVFWHMAQTMLGFISRGASMLRFDAAHFLWKESGTICVNLAQAHAVIKALRAVADLVDPNIVVVSETNIPHDENITYFGNGHDEAQMVYNFALPTVTVHTLHTGDSHTINTWVSSLDTGSPDTAFFNYTASHDGISVRGSAQILSVEQRRAMIQRSIDHGGRILYRSTPTGDIPYEMNITYYDVLSPWRNELAIDRFIVSQAISLALAGVPGVYLSSLFGAHTWQDGVLDGGGVREVNRQRFDFEQLQNQLKDPSTRRGQVFEAYHRLLRARRFEPSFHPQGAQEVLDFGPGLFGLLRTATDGSRRVFAVHNVTSETQRIDLGPQRWQSILRDDSFSGHLDLAPYRFAWLLDPEPTSCPDFLPNRA